MDTGASGIMIWFRRLHKWIGLAIGLQVAVWMLSGLMMGLLDHEQVQGHGNLAGVSDPPLFSAAPALVEPGTILNRLPHDVVVRGINLQSLLDQRVYRLDSPDHLQLFDANTGQPVEITEDVARRIAQKDYSGPGRITATTPVGAPSMEIRRHQGAAWRVDFDDDKATSLYVSARDGAILERRNNTWRLFDVFWMLHIMDYQGREEFNNLLAIFASLVAAWFSITGIVLFFGSFRKEDFLGLLPASWWRKRAGIAVLAPHGEVVARIDSYAGGRLYDELAAGDIVLPSNCGGGGTCGLCVVNLEPDWPESPADIQLIPEHQRRQGVRLSCQAKVADNMAVGISDDVLSAELTSAEVTDCRFVTPFIREIRLRVDNTDFDYPAGSYVHVVIPRFEVAYADLELTEEVRIACQHLDMTKKFVNETEVRRAYSLATPPDDHRGEIVLNVRFMPPPEPVSDVSAGIGSSFMWSLENGDRLDIVGPLGDFNAQPTDRDMIFLGGGAGMAPLRSIIRSELLFKKSERKIDFWYGGRGRKDLFYVSEFDSLQEEHANFEWQPVLSEPSDSDGWSGPTGFVHMAAREGLLSRMEQPQSCEFYICGPPPMLLATRQMLSDLGVPETQVFFDDFGI